MATYKLGNCEAVFKEREFFLFQLESLRENVQNVFGIVQNSDAVLTDSDLGALEHFLDCIRDDMRKFNKSLTPSVERILDYIESCEVKPNAN